MERPTTPFHFDAYDPVAEDWISYIERLEAYYEMNDIEMKKRVPAIISVMGPQSYNALKSTTSKRPTELKFEEIVHLLKDYYERNKSEESESNKFVERPSPNFQTMQMSTPGQYPQSGNYSNPIPMTHQPRSGINYPPMGNPADNWMPPPALNSNCPVGLEYLSVIDQILVHQKIELMELITGFEMKNEYSVKNSMGQMIYTAKEESTSCDRCCWGSSRPFDMMITDYTGREVIHMVRPFGCTCCCIPFCFQRIEVTSPPGTLIGTVIEECHIFNPSFRVENEYGETIFKIEGPCCVGCKCGDTNFKVYTPDNHEIGKITKQWSGFVREAYTDADNFSITFPLNIDVKKKAILLGALMLIDYMYFETQPQQRR